MTGGVRVNIIVEGQTEETFVRDYLAGALGAVGVFATARRVETRRRSDRIHRGGMTSFAKAERDIRRWLSQDRLAYVATMFDLYGLPTDFPSFQQAQGIQDPHSRVSALEDALASAMDNHRFVPYIQLHEWEALLFSSPEAIDAALSLYGRSRLRELRQICAQYESPEHIDDGETTAPSKRLVTLYPAYDKLAFGPGIAARVGLEVIRSKCRHFDEWLAKLEGLKPLGSSS